LRIDTHDSGLRIPGNYGFSCDDALIAAAALEADCSMLYSEDFQDGPVIQGRLTVRNPYAANEESARSFPRAHNWKAAAPRSVSTAPWA